VGAEESEARPRGAIGGKYRALRAIGQGGMGVVYEAEHLGGGERVAIKILDRDWAKDPAVAGRFAREGKAASAASSDHIVRVLDGGTHDGCPYLVMQLLEGEDLGTRLRRKHKLPVTEAARITREVLAGLAAAHARGVVHRDLKPDNVILARRSDGPPRATIVDFGMSKIDRPPGATEPLTLTRKGVVIGTPLYMSPEQVRASPELDARSDLYSVGAMLFELLAGRPPHVGPTYEQILLGICMKDAPDVRTWAPGVSAELAAFVAKALAREPDARFESAEAMSAALFEAMGVAPPDPRGLRRQARVRLVVAATVAMLAGAILTLLAVALVGK
jgi:eukaryotic-like serine/threonine-protein kinase